MNKQNDRQVWQNYNLPIDERVDDLVSRLTLDEKVAQMIHSASSVPHLGIPEYNWWNECLHGVGRSGISTVFPQAIGLSSSFNTKLMHRVADAISDEARAKHHEYVRQGDHDMYKGLTFWSPNVNIFRDPRWGRGQETYGEDPFLTGRMGISFIKGLQGDDPEYIKIVATPKHFAAHSGPEALRHQFNAQVSIKDLRETYLPAFKACVVEGKAVSVMGAYSRTNDEACCASKTLLQKILREEWGFEGYVVSDCKAICDIHQHHKITSSPEESAALAVKNGCDLNCGKVYHSLLLAVKKGLIEEETIDLAVSRLMRARMQLGMFDPPERVSYTQIPYSVNDCKEHRHLSLQMARESIVLLKNDENILPLEKDLKCIAVIGPNAHDNSVLLGNYSGTPSGTVTFLDGIRSLVDSETEIMYARGCDWLINEEDEWGVQATEGFSEACAAAERADVVILCLGINSEIEGEEGAASLSNFAGDRDSIDLPEIQQRLLKAVMKKGKPIIIVLSSGSPVSINYAHEHVSVSAILQTWYPGEEGGTALAEVVFGDYNPAGRLPVTFVKSIDQLPLFEDYNMRGRTYRYLKEEPLYPFGYGLSYTDFSYRKPVIDRKTVVPGESVEVSVQIENTGQRAGDEVVQLYLEPLKSSVVVPRWELQGFTRIHLKPGEMQKVKFSLSARQMALIDADGRCVLEPRSFRIHIGGRQPDKRSETLTKSEIVSTGFGLSGSRKEIPY